MKDSIRQELGEEAWGKLQDFCRETGSTIDSVLYTETGRQAFLSYQAAKISPVTVKQLLEICKEQIEAGNGDKVVLISDDDEGNGFHTLFYGFLSDPEKIRVYQGQFHDGNDPDDVVILG